MIKGVAPLAVTYTVYADILWLVNFAADYVLLAATARFGGFCCRRARLALAAALGAFYGVGLLFPALSVLYIMPLPVAASAFMLLLGFGRMPIKGFGRLLLCFYLLSFAMGGTALAVRFLLGRGLAAPLSVGWLLPALALAGSLSLLGVGWFKRAVRQSGLIVQAEICFNGRRLKTGCFLDSGNKLKEPLSGRPVMLIEIAAAAGLLPGELYDALAEGLRRQAAGGDFRPYELLLAMQARDFGRSLFLLPYIGVSGVGQVGLAFLPDSVCYTLADGRKLCPKEPPLLLPVGGRLRGLSAARALIDPAAVFSEDRDPAPLLQAEQALYEYSCERQGGRSA